MYVQNLKMLAAAHNGVFRHCDTLWYKAVFVLFCSFRNQAAESIQAEVNQYCIIICAPDHTSELDINPNLITCYFLLCNKSMIQAHISFIWPLN